MPISSVTANQNLSTDPGQKPTGKSEVVIADFGEFLKLFVSQLKYQDPLSPLKGDDFLAQTAQFSSVEQLVSLNQKAGNSTAALEAFSRASAAALIGRTAIAWVPEETGVTRQVEGRVIRVDYGQGGEMLLGLEDGTFVPFSGLISVSEI